MAVQRTSVLVLALLAASFAVLASAQPKPGKVFPFYDNCRRQQGNQLRNLTYTGRSVLKGGVVQFCFKIDLLKSKCTPEIFKQKGVSITSRCCDTTFAKIKFYVNAACKRQLLPSQLTVPKMPSMNKLVSPNWEYTKPDLLKYTSVKYTQFGPIPQSAVDGTTFCLRVSPPTGASGSTCKTDSLLGITNPNSPNASFASIYDRKVNNYECCPTFKFSK